jgi:diguanylate cyclase (GGDEF)-like protein
MASQALRAVVDDETETSRLSALDEFDIMDTPAEIAFERIARLIRLSLGVKTAIVSLMDGHRQWYKAAEGAAVREVPLGESFCKELLTTGLPMVVGNASEDPRFQANPHVTADGGVRFYAGVPLRTRQGQVIGSVCAIDPVPRPTAGSEIAILAELAELAMNELELRRLATVDGLTGTMSRRAFKEATDRQVALARRHRNALSLIAFDLDHFKTINDTYGHPAGDQVLAGVARAVTSQLRTSDLFGRLGGEEFAVLLPHTDAARAYDVAEKLRAGLRAVKFPGSHPPIIASASFGVATFDPGTDDTEQLFTKADEALYDAKRSGRNRSSAWRPSGAAIDQDRRRVLKAGKLVFNNRFSAVDCTVRWLWETGAEVTVSNTHGVPDEVNLVIRSDHADWHCKITTRTDTRVVLEFV